MTRTLHISHPWVKVIGLLAFLAAPLLLESFTVSLINDIGIFALVALGLVLLTGMGGTTSFGHAAFVGIAAYSTGWLSATQGFSPWVGLLFSVSITTFAALIIGALTLRLGGHFLALSTIAWGLSVPILFGNMPALGGHGGLQGIPAIQIMGIVFDRPERIFYLIWGIFLLCYLFSVNLLGSRKGRAIQSLRGGPLLLSSVTARAFGLRLQLFITSAFFAGLAGWLYAHNFRFISPSPFDVHASIQYLFMAVSGGISYLLGGLIGPALVLRLRDMLQDVLPLITDRSAQVESLAFAIFFILIMHFARGGVMGIASRYVPGLGQIRRKVALDSTAAPLPRRSMPEQGSPILEVNQVTKRFGGLVAVNEVSFDVKAREIVGLIGPNGAGKSTMFNLITRTLPMTSGNVRFLGHDISNVDQATVAGLGLARTFQHVKLRPRMTLLDNVALGAYQRTQAGLVQSGLGLDRLDEKRVMAEAMRQLERVGLADRAYDMAGSLPLGNQRVLEVARALASDPALLILDEPAAGLRRNEKEALSALLKSLRDEGVTILIVEHDMEFVMNLVDRLVVMNFGAKLAEGLPAEIRVNPDVQTAYLGAPL